MKKHLPLLTTALVALLAPLPAARAQSPNQKAVIFSVISDSLGTITKRKGSGSYSPMTLPQQRIVELFNGEVIRTGSDSAIQLIFGEHGYLRIGANSTVAIEGDRFSISFKVLEGQVWILSGNHGVRLFTPSATVTAPDNALLGVGYDPASDSTIVSVNAGTANVSLPRGNWKGAANAGQFVQYLRNPKPNIRLRAPQVAVQTEAQVAMWKRLSIEPWTQRKIGKLTRGIEADLQVLVPAKKVSKDNKP